MSRLLSAIVMTIGFLAAVPKDGQAEEPAKEFLEALRSRGDYDQALEYLDSIPKNAAVPAAFQETLLYERGITLVLGAKWQKDAAVRSAWLADGQRSLQKFVAEHKEHPLATQALNHLGNVLVERARELSKRAETATGEPKSKLLTECRQLYAEAQAAFESTGKTAGDRLKALAAKVDDPRKTDEQQRLRMDLLQALLLVAATSEEAAETFAKGSEERKEAFADAASRYEKIYQDYRTRLAGLYARMYQARCLQKLGQHKESLVLFDELLTNPDSPGAFRSFKIKVVILAADSWLEEKQYQAVLDSIRPILEGAQESEEKTPEFLELRLKYTLAAKALAEGRKK